MNAYLDGEFHIDAQYHDVDCGGGDGSNNGTFAYATRSSEEFRDGKIDSATRLSVGRHDDTYKSVKCLGIEGGEKDDNRINDGEANEQRY